MVVVNKAISASPYNVCNILPYVFFSLFRYQEIFDVHTEESPWNENRGLGSRAFSVKIIVYGIELIETLQKCNDSANTETFSYCTNPCFEPLQSGYLQLHKYFFHNKMYVYGIELINKLQICTSQSKRRYELDHFFKLILRGTENQR